MSVLKIKQWAWPYIKNFRTYIDVGALDGDTSAPFIKNFKKVIAFEPNPEQYKLIPEGIEKYNVGLGDKTEKRILKLPDNGLNLAAHGSLVKYSTGIKQFDVQLERLDDYSFTDVDFVKIDVEHFELQVCKGAEITYLGTACDSKGSSYQTTLTYFHIVSNVNQIIYFCHFTNDGTPYCCTIN